MSPGLDSVDLSCDKCDGEELGAVLGERCRGLTPLSVVFTNRRGGCVAGYIVQRIIQHFDYDVCQVGDGISVEIGIYSNIYLMKQ